MGHQELSATGKFMDHLSDRPVRSTGPGRSINVSDLIWSPNLRGPEIRSRIELGTAAPQGLTNMSITEYVGAVARSSTTSDVFNAIGDAHRREVLDALITGEKAVGAIVGGLSMSQPQVSKHLRVLREVGLVRCRKEGRRRLYRLEPAHLEPFREWLSSYEEALNARLERMDGYLKELQRQQGGLQ